MHCTMPLWCDRMLFRTYTLDARSPHALSIGLRSGLNAGQWITWMCCALNHAIVDLALWMDALSCWNFQFAPPICGPNGIKSQLSSKLQIGGIVWGWLQSVLSSQSLRTYIWQLKGITSQQLQNNGWKWNTRYKGISMTIDWNYAHGRPVTWRWVSETEYSCTCDWTKI